MSSFVVLVGLQFYILFFIQENFVIADEKTSLETSKRQVVGQCGDKKSDPLDTKIHWKDACYDFDGNSYKDGDFLMSCCGCFKFICSNKTKEDPPCDDKYGWDKVLEATCCEDCHGQVFPAGSVIKEQKLQDKCSTTVTTKCVLASGEKKATIDESLSYEKCCSNSSGVYPLNTSVLVPALCSVRVCSRPAGRHEASWTLTKKTTGCDCCQYRGKLIADKDWVIIGTGYNARNATCCEGKLLVSIDDEDVSSTTSEDETVGITTNVDEEISITQEVEKSTALVVTGGNNGVYLATSETIGPAGVCSIGIPPLPVALESLNSVFIDDNLMTCGGYDGKDTQDACYFLKDYKSQWIKGPSMKIPRRHYSLTRVGKDVFAVGGVGENHVRVDSMEKYTGGEWTLLPQKLSDGYRIQHCTVYLKSLHSLVVIGGNPVGNKVQSFNISSGQWTDLAPLPLRFLTYHRCIVLDETIYVTGGEADRKAQKKVYKYKGGNWEISGELEEARMRHSIGLVDGKVMVVGGYNLGENRVLTSVETMDHNGNWKKEAWDISEGRFAMARAEVPSESFPSQCGCSAGTEFMGNCYELVETSSEWDVAAQDCSSRGGALASIFNEKVNTFLARLAGTRTWIGGSDRGKEGVWVWPNGDEITYTNWSGSEPNDTGGDEDCMEINYANSPSGKWNDISCSNKFRYICQFSMTILE